ncbi:MAG TPA: ParA family protein [Candidatus Tripitaka californicus]|nr:hypothetical protein [Planctomycetota bacterium]
MSNTTALHRVWQQPLLLFAHQDILAFAPGSRGAEDYAKLAKELLKLWEE